MRKKKLHSLGTGKGANLFDAECKKGQASIEVSLIRKAPPAWNSALKEQGIEKLGPLASATL